MAESPIPLRTLPSSILRGFMQSSFIPGSLTRSQLFRTGNNENSFASERGNNQTPYFDAPNMSFGGITVNPPAQVIFEGGGTGTDNTSSVVGTDPITVASDTTGSNTQYTVGLSTTQSDWPSSITNIINAITNSTLDLLRISSPSKVEKTIYGYQSDGSTDYDTDGSLSHKVHTQWNAEKMTPFSTTRNVGGSTQNVFGWKRADPVVNGVFLNLGWPVSDGSYPSSSSVTKKGDFGSSYWILVMAQKLDAWDTTAGTNCWVGSLPNVYDVSCTP